MTPYWLGWIAAFLLLEGYALKNTKGGTLSSHVWRWFSIKERSKGWLLRRIALGGFVTWLAVHFMTGGAI